jgi:di/tricarboxylate transporter
VGFEAWFTILIVAALVGALASNKIGPDTAMLGALTALLVAGVLEPAEAAVGFADPSILMIAALFVVAAGLNETGAVEAFAQRMLGRPKSERAAQIRLMVPVAAMSAFMNNTPIVAMYLPIVHDWARKLQISPSKLFMPLSFAAILGGACTLIGTSTNIAINQLWVSYFEVEGERLGAQFGIQPWSTMKQFWAIALLGVPVAVLSIPFIALTSRWLLPERIAPDALKGEREYTVGVEVKANSPVVGKTIEQAGLRSLPGLFLSSIERGGQVLPAVGPEEVLSAEDRLVFVGIVESVVDLLKTKGLEPETEQVGKVDTPRAARTVVEAVVSHNSPLVSRSVKQSQFRTRYNAAIIAVHRNGQRINKKIGDIVLLPGDTLLLSTHIGFIQAYRNSSHFYLVSSVTEAREVRHERAWVAVAIMGLLVTLMTVPTAPLFRILNERFGGIGLDLPATGMPPLAVGFLCATTMVFTRCCTGTRARSSVNWQVLLVIGAAIGVGKAMTKTGAAQAIADVIFDVIGGLGLRGVLLIFALMTSVFCQLITNKGAAILMFPIAMALAKDIGDGGVNPEPFVLTLMISAACSFLTPVGFVTNMMVYGPGGYRFHDYMRLGLPLTLLSACIATIFAPMLFPFNPGG